jgi:hypothetical protein
MLATDSALAYVRLILASRPDTPGSEGMTTLQVDVADDSIIASYLVRRGVPESLHGSIAGRAQGNWLIARLLADQALIGANSDPELLPGDLVGIYAQSLRRAGAATSDRWRNEFRPLLGVLAVAGTGPILPLGLLCTASELLGGPSRPFRVRDLLVDLRGLVVRLRPGTDEEHVGLFHPTFGVYLLDPGSGCFSVDPADSHQAIVCAINTMAPRGAQPIQNPVQRYAVIREADHLWALGQHREVEDSLLGRKPRNQAERVQRFDIWRKRFHENVPTLDRLSIFKHINAILLSQQEEAGEDYV